MAEGSWGGLAGRAIRKVRKHFPSRGGKQRLEAALGQTPAALVERAQAFYAALPALDPQSRVPAMADAIRGFDLERMERVISICRWGSSGSLLLHSYFDGHDEVILLPGNLGGGIYAFFDCHPSLSLRDKLLAYPFACIDGFDNSEYYFAGDHPIDPAAYQAAANALVEVIGTLPREFAESRRAFFVSLHVAYCVALGRLPATRVPVIVYMQALANPIIARYLVEDFPRTRFIHTVRDPITNVGRLFEHDFRYDGVLAPFFVVARMSFADQPHAGMQAGSRAVRFEDLHLRLEQTMRSLVAWLGIAYRPSLLESTWNGDTYVWKATTGEAWTGARPDKAKRNAKNASAVDRFVLFCVFNEDFVAWNYPHAPSYGRAPVRLLAIPATLIPTKMELRAARLVFSSGSARRVLSGIVQLGFCRVAIATILAGQLCTRIVRGKRLLQPLAVESGAAAGPVGRKPESVAVVHNRPVANHQTSD